MKNRRHSGLLDMGVVVVGLVLPFLAGAISVTDIGNLGPTGLEVTVRPDLLVEITKVQEGSPAEGKFTKGQLIRTINGQGIPEDGRGPQVHLARRITDAEATDGRLRFAVQETPEAEPEEVVVDIPVLGAFSESWPMDCEKTRRIIRNKADAIARLVETSGDGFTSHNLHNALAILFLLSTGEAQDLEVVRGIYARRMDDFEGPDTGSHSWHNGYQGIAVAEYYLRTGDSSVMPLINAICESARKYQVHGGWTHWAKGVNPQYVAGGLMNPAGTQILTTLLLAKQAGADVDEQTLHSALRFFYRFAGHGSSPYGDHRPEAGYGSNNGKSEMLAVAMQVASQASEGGENYARARDKNAQTPLFSTAHMLQGHTGGGLGALWHGIASSFMTARRPALYRHRKDSIQWFYELSRRHDGLFGICGGQRYDQIQYGYGMGLALTAPLRTLRITGAPASEHVKAFSLPARIWGREADLAFFDLDGGEAYGELATNPERERETIASLDAAGLERMAQHPEHVYREMAAAAIRDHGHTRLIESLLQSENPFARQTGCLAINTFEPWNMRSSRGIQSRLSLDREQFTQAMFDALLAMIANPDEAWWTVNHALLALPAASAEQVISRMDDILPWLEHDEWWLVEAATIALAPAMRDKAAMARILPAVMHAMSDMEHARPRGTIGWFLDRATRAAPEAILDALSMAYVDLYQRFPSVPDPEPGVDHSGITSVALHGLLNSILSGGPAAILAGARASVGRIEDMRGRELNLIIDSLIQAGQRLEDDGRREVGHILQRHYRPVVVGDDPPAMREKIQAGRDMGTMNKLLQIDRMAGQSVGWHLQGNRADGEQEWWHTSFRPVEELPPAEMNRYRTLKLPPRLEGWYEPEYDPRAKGWLHETEVVGDAAPHAYRGPERWQREQLPEAEEVIFTRKTFVLEDVDAVMYRVVAYTRQGYDIYLNGHRIAGTGGRSRTWQPHVHYLNETMREQLREGANVIAARSFLQYFRGKEGNIEVFVEALPAFPEVK